MIILYTIGTQGNHLQVFLLFPHGDFGCSQFDGGDFSPQLVFGFSPPQPGFSGCGNDPGQHAGLGGGDCPQVGSFFSWWPHGFGGSVGVFLQENVRQIGLTAICLTSISLKQPIAVRNMIFCRAFGAYTFVTRNYYYKNII